MKRMVLDTADVAVKEFVRSLPSAAEALELELSGRVVGVFLPSAGQSVINQVALLARGRELVARVRERNTGVPDEEIEREVDAAVKEVRAQAQR